MRITIHLPRRVVLVTPLALAALAAAAWGGAALASSATPTTLTVCVKEHGPLTAVAAGGSCSSNATAYVLVTQDALDALDARVSTLESDNATLAGRVSTLESDDSATKALLSGVSRTTFHGNDTLQFSGMNLQIVNGSGRTPVANGLGNLIVGYDESVGDAGGSHNVVVGEGDSFSSFGGLVVGDGNTISGAFATVSGGADNSADGVGSSVSGGGENHASGDDSAISGGIGNGASGDLASVSGGAYNIASGVASSILGGHGVTVSTTNGTSP